MDEYKKVKCFKCGKNLEEQEKIFVYLEREFSHNVLCCPECGQVFLPEMLVKGRMKQIEMMLEGK